LVELVYETGQWLNDTFAGENVGAGNIGYQRRIKDNEGTASTPRELIIEPWDEPPTWSSSTRNIKMTRYKDATGNTLRHANYLPLTEGIDIDMQLEVHTFTWNVRKSTFNFETDVAPYIGKINDSVIVDLKDAPIKHVLLETCTCTENYRTVNIGVPVGQAGNGIQTLRFITLTATFVIDRRSTADSPEGYFREANRRVSMHTLQALSVPVGLGLVTMLLPIQINDRGDFATAPWPLAPTGLAIAYDQMSTVDPETDFAIIDPELPIEADLDDFVTTHKLEIP
jgi:hypothetical protein